jgi:hypothetical protein
MYDTLVIELQKEGKSMGSISILKRDLDNLVTSHDVEMSEIVLDMIKTLENGIDGSERKN